MPIFSSTYASAKSSRPRAMAPTKTAILCVVGNVGRYFESFCVGASPDRAYGMSKLALNTGKNDDMDVLILIVLAGRWSVTGFYGTGRDGCQMLITKDEETHGHTLTTLSSFSGPLTPLMESLCKS